MKEKPTKDLFRKLAKKNGEHHEPIFDGIVDADRFKKATSKVLWILREPWEILEGDARGGGWSIVEEIAKNENFGKGVRTYDVISRITFAIQNKIYNFKEANRLVKKVSFNDSCKTLALVNIKKFPGSTKSSHRELNSYSILYGDFILRQIEEIDPDVVIFGGTYGYMKRVKEFNVAINIHYGFESISNGVKDGRLYIEAYHPSQWTAVSQEIYFNEIVESIKNHVR